MMVTLMPSATSAFAALIPSNVPGTLTTMTSGSYFASAMPFFHMSSEVAPHVWTWNSCTASYSSACFARFVRASRVHSRPSRSRMIGFVVTPVKMPEGSHFAHSSSLALSRNMHRFPL